MGVKVDERAIEDQADEEVPEVEVGEKKILLHAPGRLFNKFFLFALISQQEQAMF